VRANAIHRSAVLAFASSLLIAGVASAQEAPRDIPPITFKISVAHALPQGGGIDPDCLELSRRLPMRFGSLTKCAPRVFRVPFGERVRMPLPTGATIQVLPVTILRNQLHMQFELPGIVNTRLQMTHGRPVILGGLPYEGGLLIIQVVPEFSHYLKGPERPGQRGPKLIEVNSPGQ
jgi:hypothetical protein